MHLSRSLADPILVVVLTSLGCRQGAQVDAAPRDAAAPEVSLPAAIASASTAPAAPSTTASSAPVVFDASAPKPLTSSYVVGRRTICMPDSWTQGDTTFAGPPRCGSTTTHRVFDSDVQRPCGPCAFSFDEASTRRERASHANVCCFIGSSPGGR